MYFKYLTNVTSHLDKKTTSDKCSLPSLYTWVTLRVDLKKGKWGRIAVKLYTYLTNSCKFKEREGQVEIKLWQSRWDPSALAVNGDRVIHSRDACSFVGQGDGKGKTGKGTDLGVFSVILFCSLPKFVLITFYSFQAAHRVEAKVRRPVVVHKEVGQVGQGLASGRQLPVQHCYHACLVALHTAL